MEDFTLLMKTQLIYLGTEQVMYSFSIESRDITQK